MALSIDDVLELFDKRASNQYGGEAVSQMEHALQCAQLAEEAGENSETIVASLLHDVGHLIAAEGAGQLDDKREHNDLHEYIGLPFLRSVLPDAVLEPIRLHVDAKRYLCAVEPGYWDTLSLASKHSLEKQGGPYSQEDAAVFLRQPYALEAIRLRRYDDFGKVPQKVTPDLAYFATRLRAVAL
jgi:phosphonate degradation associated HDIG domain protein